MPKPLSPDFAVSCVINVLTLQNREMKRFEAENLQPVILSAQAMQPLKNVEFLDTQKAAILLGVSRSFIYYLINTGKLVAYNLSVRRTIILKRDIEQLFQSKLLMAPLPKKQVSKMPVMDDCYNMSELHEKFKISDAAIYNLIKRNNIDKFQVGRFTYVSKKNIDSILFNQI